jgi:hypothetical protein
MVGIGVDAAGAGAGLVWISGGDPDFEQAVSSATETRSAGRKCLLGMKFSVETAQSQLGNVQA